MSIISNHIDKLVYKSTFEMLQQGQAQVFIVNIKDSRQIIHEKETLLSKEELDIAYRFRQLADAERFKSGRIVLKLLLSKYVNQQAGDIVITPGKNNKPYAALQYGSCIFPQFNISHSGDFLVTGISMSNIGVDVEYIKVFDIAGILQQSFSLHEQAYINNSSNPLHQFYKLWTRKEAYLKATGQGMIDNLNRLELIYPLSQNLDDRRDYKMYSFNPTPDYASSVCFHSGAEGEICFFSRDAIF